jgi:hypothetical protein
MKKLRRIRSVDYRLSTKFIIRGLTLCTSSVRAKAALLPGTYSVRHVRRLSAEIRASGRCRTVLGGGAKIINIYIVGERRRDVRGRGEGRRVGLGGAGGR